MWNRQLWTPRGILGKLCAAAILSALIAISARAAVSITTTAPNLTLPYSTSLQSGTFEVYVQASGSPMPQVGDFGVELQLPSFSGVTFSGSSTPFTGPSTTPTVHPYIYSGQSPVEKVINSGRTVEGADFAESSVPTLTNGVGLLLVTYSIPAGASGVYPLTFIDYSATNPAGTGLFDNSTPLPLQIPTTDQNGSITILPPTAYWQGTVDGNWTTDNLQTGVTNWTIDSAGTTDTHVPPGASTDVFFTGSGAGNLNTTLGSDFSIKGLTFTSTATNPVTIGGNTLTLGADGLTVQSGSAAHTINSAVALGGSQTWRIGNASSTPLTVAGALSIPAATTLTKSDVGKLVISGAPTFGNNSSLVVSGGTLKFNLNSASANVGTGVTATVAAGATLELAGSVPALTSGTNRVNVANNSTVAGGGLLISGTGQQLGAVTGTGNLTIDAGSDLTVNSIQQTALIIGGTATSPATVTIRATDSQGLPLTDGPLSSLDSSQPFAAGLTSSSLAALSAATLSAGESLRFDGGALSAGDSVPEPSALLLMLLALLGMRIVVRRSVDSPHTAYFCAKSLTKS